MFRFIESLLLLFVFLLPWQARFVIRAGELNGGFWEYGTVALYATDVLFILIVVFSIIWFILQRGSATISNFKFLISKQSQNSKSVGYLFFFLGYVFLSVFWAPHQVVAMVAAFKLLEGAILFFLIRLLPIDWSKLVWAFIVSALVQSILAIMQFATQSVIPFEWSGIAPHMAWLSGGPAVVETATGRWLRAYGSFPHPNLLGAYLAIAFVLLLSKSPLLPPFLKGDRGGFSYVSVVICQLLLLTGLFFTFSRAAWFATVLGTGYWVLVTRAWRDRFFHQTLLLVTGYSLLVTILFFPLVTTRLSSTGRLETRSTVERLSGYRESWQLLKQHPIFGVGVGNYTVAVHNELRPHEPAWTYQPVHNFFVLILTELGLIGFLLFIGFCVTVWKGVLGTGYLGLGTLAILAILDHSFWTLQSGILLLWFFLALLREKNSVDNV